MKLNATAVILDFRFLSFEVQNNSPQFAQFAGLIVSTVLGILLTVLRFVAIRRGSRKPSAEDWLAVVATFFSIGTNLSGLMGGWTSISDLLDKTC